MKSNHGKIADTLLGVSFVDSRLPQKVLTQRTPGEDQTDMDLCCDLEHDARELARELMDQQTVQVDVRNMDQQLLILAQRFQEAVEKGYTATAFATLDGLVRGVHEIRARVPQNDLTFCNQYVEVNTSYLKEWVQLCDLVKAADLMRENVERRQVSYDSEKEEVDKWKDVFWNEMNEDERRREVFLKIYQYEYAKPEERLDWSNEVWETYKTLVELRFKQVDLDLQDDLLGQEQNCLNALEGQVDLLKGKLMSLPIVQNPNQLNEFQDAMEDMIREMAQLNAALDETLSAMDKIEAWLMRIKNAQDDLRMRATAWMQARKIVEQLREEDKMRQDTTGTKIVK